VKRRIERCIDIDRNVVDAFPTPARKFGRIFDDLAREGVASVTTLCEVVCRTEGFWREIQSFLTRYLKKKLKNKSLIIQKHVNVYLINIKWKPL